MAQPTWEERQTEWRLEKGIKTDSTLRPSPKVWRNLAVPSGEVSAGVSMWGVIPVSSRDVSDCPTMESVYKLLD